MPFLVIRIKQGTRSVPFFNILLFFHISNFYCLYVFSLFINLKLQECEWSTVLYGPGSIPGERAGGGGGAGLSAGAGG
jgi:hypothetical protein